MSKYLEMLESAKYERLSSQHSVYSFSKDNHIGFTYIPACKADIRFKVGKYKIAPKKYSLTKEEKELPKTWKNYDNTSNDIKLLLSTRPQNQGKCGSCFAMSTSNVISDNFLFGMNLDYNPNLSPMYLLSCYKDPVFNNQCNGGSPSLLIDRIIEKGITTNCCMDYDSICKSNEYCNVNGEKHLDKGDTSVLNAMIPKCGCCNSQPQKIYKIKNKVVSHDVPMIKLHIMKYGSAIGGFIVFSNFVGDHGKFLKSNGIYIQSIDYCLDNSDPTGVLGGHAISIVGWGVDYNVKVEDVVYPSIEYWICRNSWGEEWGYGGYFKYAMFQKSDSLPSINEHYAFETDNTFKDQPNLGGIILIEPDGIYEFKDSEIDCGVSYTCKLEHSVKKEKEKEKEKEKKNPVKHKNYILYIILVLLFILLLFRLFKITNKKAY